MTTYMLTAPVSTSLAIKHKDCFIPDISSSTLAVILHTILSASLLQSLLSIDTTFELEQDSTLGTQSLQRAAAESAKNLYVLIFK